MVETTEKDLIDSGDKKFLYMAFLLLVFIIGMWLGYFINSTNDYNRDNAINKVHYYLDNTDKIPYFNHMFKGGDMTINEAIYTAKLYGQTTDYGIGLMVDDVCK